MKKFLLLFTFITCFSVLAHSNVHLSSPSDVERGGGNPWPWGKEAEFPIDGIQGLYTAEINETPFMFSIRVIRTGKTIKLLNIRMIDQNECRLMAQGVGFHTKTYVTGALKDVHDTTQEAFQISLRVFDEHILEPGKVDQKYIRNGQVMVVSIGEFGQIMNLNDMSSAPIRKVSNNPTKKCEPMQ